MELLRKLPKVNELLEEELVKSCLKKLPRELVVSKLRLSINTLRERILKMEDLSSIFSFKEESLRLFQIEINKLNKNNLKRVINGTGIVIHTNLGRSLLSEESIRAIENVSKHYCNLEYDLNGGKRGDRYSTVVSHLRYLTGAEDAIVVNNNAAAVLLTLSAICKDKEVIISRGEMIEIGGAFRIPDIMNLSGGKLIEVGTTNRTHLRDYEDAITEKSAALLKIHTSNYKILGYTKSVDSKELKELSEKYNIPIIEDLGSGLIEKLSINELDSEKTVKECVENGVDIVTFSGDKLLGGPQCGIIVGKAKLINKIKSHQLNRAVRVDKFTLAALEATLKEYIKGTTKNIPTVRLLELSSEEIEKKVILLKEEIDKLNKGFLVYIEKEKSLVGGGALPLLELETAVLKIMHPNIKDSIIEKKLRSNEIPIITRVSKGKVIIDGRCILEEDIDVIKKAFNYIGD